MESMNSGILGATNRSAPAVLATPRSADAHHGRMNAMASIAIPLHSRKYPGLVALIDDDQLDKVSSRRWNPILIRGSVYAASGHGTSRLYLHRFVTDATEGTDVDHINGDGLDNRRQNLRTCSHRQNQMNIVRAVKPVSGFRGVTQTSRSSTWSASIKIHGRRIYLGSFRLPEDAARAYDEAARREFGEFGTYNFPVPGERSAITGEVVP